MKKSTMRFKIGQFHGKLNPDESSVEAHLRNQLYLIGNVILPTSIEKNIRLIGYEVPVKKDRTSPRGDAIDLLGYDQNHIPCIFELKQADTNEDKSDIVNQINRYETLFDECRNEIENEIQIKFNWPDFAFSPGLIKIILIPRNYFQKTTKLGDLLSHPHSDIHWCSFARYQNIIDDNGKVHLLDKCGGKGNVTLNLIK